MTESNQWQKALLGNHCDLLAGYSFKSANFTNSLEDIPLVKGENLGHRSIDWINAPRWTASEAADLERFSLQTGDVVLAMDRPIVQNRLKFSWIRETDPYALLVQRVARLRGINGLQTEFLKHLIASPSFQAHIEIITTGANVPHISGRDILSYSFRLPSETDQERIATILSNYDRLIDNNTRRIALLEESIHRLYQEWFVYLRFPGCDRVAIVDGVPEGWSHQPIEKACELVMGQSPPSTTYNTTGQGLPFHQGVTKFGSRFISHETYCTQPNRIAEPGDILCSVRAPVGRLNMTLDKIIIGRGLAAIRNRQGYQSFQLYQLKSHFFKEDLIGSGSIYASVTKKQLSDQIMLIPSEPVLQAFECLSKPVDQQIINLHLQNKHLREARDLVLPRLMNGSLAV